MDDSISWKVFHRRYTRSKAFRTVKKIVDFRDGGKCVACGRPGVDHHHRSYKNLGVGGAKEAEDVYLFCKGCHKMFHKRKKIKPEDHLDINTLIKNDNGTYSLPPKK